MTNEPLDQATLEAVARVEEQLEVMARYKSQHSVIINSDLRTILDALAKTKEAQ